MCVSQPDSDREDAVTESKADVLVVPPKQMSSALGSLLANYGSTSESDSGDEPEGKFAPTLNEGPMPNHQDQPISSNLICKGFMKLSPPYFLFDCYEKPYCHFIPMYSIMILCLFSCDSAIPIQRTKDCLQENQALLRSVPPTNKDTGRPINTNVFSERANTGKVHQHNSVPNTPHNRRGGRGRGRRGGRGEYQDAPQSRRPTLLEMVKTPVL